jgi:pimeloyl-ACP methyl ester carboxylesterase
LAVCLALYSAPFWLTDGQAIGGQSAQKEEPQRAQTPKPPFPYEDREVTYINVADGTILAGTLTVPKGKERCPAVILLPGSGPVDRNETMLPGHKPFMVMADHLTRRGMAVLRVDDREVGKSSGDYSKSTGDDLAGDVMAGIAFLKRQPEIDAGRIGLIGHSQGGGVAALVGAKSKDVAFIVFLAAPALPAREFAPLQLRTALKGKGASEEEIAQRLSVLQRLFDAVKANAGDDEIRPLTQEMIKAAYPLGALSEKDLKDITEKELARLRSPNVRYFMFNDARESLRQIRVPLLALNGSLDHAIAPEENLNEIKRLTQEANNPDVTILKLYGLNHLFQSATTGAPAEMMRLEETFSTKALEIMTAWIRARTKLDQ